MTMQKWCALLLLMLSWSVRAEEVQVAVAANFSAPMQQIATRFEQQSGHKVLLSFGATGKFYAQIKNAAPFDILLAADQATPTRLTLEAVPATQFTYAIGSLVLWSATPGLVDPHGAVLRQDSFRHLAIASPVEAPYGAAALQTLKSLHLYETLSPKLVEGESIGQAYAFVATGNAELGFVALSQIWEGNAIRSGSAWIVPENLYTPLRQDAVLLRRGEKNPAALALMSYLKSDAAREVMRRFGYHF
jgi:molybdate transport system substrate-binding protein